MMPTCEIDTFPTPSCSHPYRQPLCGIGQVTHDVRVLPRSEPHSIWALPSIRLLSFRGVRNTILSGFCKTSWSLFLSPSVVPSFNLWKMSQVPRSGQGWDEGQILRAPSGHSSHQSSRDLSIWLWTPGGQRPHFINTCIPISIYCHSISVRYE